MMKNRSMIPDVAGMTIQIPRDYKLDMTLFRSYKSLEDLGG